MILFKKMREKRVNKILDAVNKKNVVKRYVMLIIGCLIMAFAFNLFFLRYNIVCFGVSGISIVLSEWINPSVFIMISNIILIIIGYFFLGIDEVKNQLVGTIIYPIFVELTLIFTDIIDLGNIEMIVIAVMGGIVYVSNACTGDIEGWDLANRKQVKVLTMPNSYRTFQNVQGRYIAHTRLFVVGNNLVAVPGTSNALVRVNLQTGKTEVLAKEFFADVLEPANNYKPQAHGIVTLAKMLDDTTLLIQKRRDASLLEINVYTGEYQVHHPKLAEGELERLLDGEDGFEKSYTNGEFARRESRYFSFEDFLDDLVHERFGDAMERQKEAMQTMAVNLDGTCGEKVHEFMMRVLG